MALYWPSQDLPTLVLNSECVPRSKNHLHSGYVSQYLCIKLSDFNKVATVTTTGLHTKYILRKALYKVVCSPLEQRSATGVPRIFIRNDIFVSYSQKKAIYFVMRICNTHTHTLRSSSVALFNMCYVSFSHTCTLTGEGCICKYIYVHGHVQFRNTFLENTFYGVLRNQGLPRVK